MPAVLRVNHLDLDFGGGRKSARQPGGACWGGCAVDPSGNLWFELTGGVTKPTDELKNVVELRKQSLKDGYAVDGFFDVNISLEARMGSRGRPLRAPSSTTTPSTRAARNFSRAGRRVRTSFYVG